MTTKSVNAILASLCFLLAATLVFNACQKDDTVPADPVMHAFSSKKNILGLSAENQKQMWLQRLEMYHANLDLNDAQKQLVTALIEDIQSLEDDKFYLSDAIKRDAVALAQIMPETDFVNLFTLDNLSPNLPVLVKSGAVCVECITDIQQYVHVENTTAGQTANDRAHDCDCRWTCSQQASHMLCDGGDAVVLPTCNGSTPTGCCNATGGCGLFGLQTCDGLAICPEDI
ncbi:MAG: bacteriocin fulvocin C-related protein [Saprospiraceae bacterium]|nr:bacteriocin fulvocin C-related protein [Saprospiraceae bacterium]